MASEMAALQNELAASRELLQDARTADGAAWCAAPGVRVPRLTPTDTPHLTPSSPEPCGLHGRANQAPNPLAPPHSEASAPLRLSPPAAEPRCGFSGSTRPR